MVDINPEAAVKGIALDEKAVQLLEERWRLLRELKDAEKSRISTYGKEMAGYDDFYDTAHRLLSDNRWPTAFKIAEEDRKRYGNNPVGISCILARNVLAQDAGTHYIHICHPGWDHHVQIWDRKAKSNHYVLCQEFDPALSSLMEDLATTPSKTNPSKTLLDETLVVVMGEFGRTPGALNNMAGRDHYNKCYPAMFAGAGVKGGRCSAARIRRERSASTPAGSAKSSLAWRTSWRRCTRRWVSTGVRRFAIPLPDGLIRTSIRLGPHGYIPTDDIATIYG